MSQHDYILDNQTGAAARADLNNLFQAIATLNSGATEPATTYAYQLWMDTTTGILKQRNSANTGWGVFKTGYPINLNGNFHVAQAGTSFAAPATGAYDLDGCRQYNNTAAVYTITQGTGSQAWKKSRITTITTADASVAAGDLVYDDFPLEGYDAVQLFGNTFTVSFSAKFPVTGIHCVALRNTAADRSYVHEVNCTAANTWANYSFTVTGGLPSTGTWVYTNTAAFSLSIVRMAGTTYTGTPATADTWMTGSYLTTANQVNDCATIGNVCALEDVRIDLGSVPGTDWPSYQENLARCKRYYQYISSIWTNAEGYGSVSIANNEVILSIKFFDEMRAIPTITTYSEDGTSGRVSLNRVAAGYVVSQLGASTKGVTIINASGGTVAAVTNATLTWKAEARL